MINLDAAFREEFFDVAVRQAVPQLPADSQQDRLAREPVSDKRNRQRRATTIHLDTLASTSTRSTNATAPAERRATM
ncbi:MAG: hypothetical protein ACI9ME_001569, partial [Ilumatobacter sp.]